MICPNCAAQLDHEPAFEPFPCPYCGTELLDPPSVILADTTKIPVQLAVERMLMERNELSVRRTRIASADAVGCAPVSGVILLVVGSLTLLGSIFGESRQDTISMTLLVLLLGTGLVIRARSRPLNPEIVRINNRIAELDRSIGEQLAILLGQ